MTDTDYGFEWGPLEVKRACVIRGSHILRIITEHHDLEIAVSPTGRSIRIYQDGQEMRKEQP